MVMKFNLFVFQLILINLPSASVSADGFFGKVLDWFGHEHCGSVWIRPNIAALKSDLAENVFGQHLVNDLVPALLQGHYANRPQKALVISFHGPTGVGKNFVSGKLAASLYKAGMKSKYVKQFIGPKHFPHASEAKQYKDHIRKTIENTVRSCSRSLFIFDEVEKIPAGVLDIVKPYLDHFEHIDGVDYRQAIFIFLSNSGGSNIAGKTLDHWKTGRPKEELRLKDFERSLALNVFNLDGGLERSSLIDRHLISAFVPFLPLERQQVKLCIKANLKLKNREHLAKQETLIDEVADELEYLPDDVQLYSSSGCKRVDLKVNMIIRTGRYQHEL